MSSGDSSATQHSMTCSVNTTYINVSTGFTCIFVPIRGYSFHESGFGYIVVMRLSCNFVNVYAIAAYRVHVYTRLSLIHSRNPNPDSSNRTSPQSQRLRFVSRFWRSLYKFVCISLCVCVCMCVCVRVCMYVGI